MAWDQVKRLSPAPVSTPERNTASTSSEEMPASLPTLRRDTLVHRQVVRHSLGDRSRPDSRSTPNRDSAAMRWATCMRRATAPGGRMVPRRPGFISSSRPLGPAQTGRAHSLAAFRSGPSEDWMSFKVSGRAASGTMRACSTAARTCAASSPSDRRKELRRRRVAAEAVRGCWPRQSGLPHVLAGYEANRRSDTRGE